MLQRFLHSMAVGLIVLASAACQDRPQNIVVISIDALNRSALRIHNPQAPDLRTLEGLAKRSRVFERAYSSASWTLPAHASLFTGLYPDRHGAVHESRKLPESITTLALELKQRGFDTVAFTGGGFVSRFFGFDRGFDRYDEWVDPDNPWEGPPLPRKGARNVPSGLTLFDRGVEFINSRDRKGERFFLFLHTYVVHDYFWVHPWAVDQLPPYPDKGLKGYLACLVGKQKASREDWARLEDLYRAECSRMDDGLDRVLTALDNRGLSDSTLLIFLSDHGEGFDPARGRVHHGGRLDEDQVRIPLLVSGPGVRPGRSDTPASLVDIMPTVLDLCRLPIPGGMDGRSFAPALRGKEEAHSRAIYAMEHYYWWEAGRRFDLPEATEEPLSMAVIRGNGWFQRQRSGVRLYDMAKDPLQKRNLAAESPLVSEFNRLAEARESYRGDAPSREQQKELNDQLRSLGYL